MDVLMDGLLATATLFAGGYCWVLSRRVNDLKSLDKGLGGAIVTLTRQVELARTTLDEARAATGETRNELGELIARADSATGQLRLLLAAVGDVEPRRGAPASEAVTLAPALRAAAVRPPAVVEAPERRVGDAEEMAAEPPDGGAAAEAAAAAVPKPRALPPIENPLRRRGGDETAPRGEDEILAALRAMAGGGGA